MQLLGGISPEKFISDYWQKKPLLIRNAIPHFQSPLSPEEMAGLACEDFIQARLVQESPKWQIDYSPFKEEVFTSLPETGYSLLISDLEKHFPEFNQLRQLFRFIPDWCFDDIMMSYAPLGGSVGAHIDQYDVFLLQSSGRKKWQIESSVRDKPVWLENCPLRILKEFNPDCDWILEPGDMLYLPPGMAHHGTSASNNCTTISVGYRTFTHMEVVSSVVDQLSNQTDKFFKNTLSKINHPALLSNDSVADFRALIKKTLELSDENLKHLLGNFLTEPHIASEIVEKITEDEITQALKQQHTFEKNLASNFSYSQTNDGLLFHADGQTLICSHEMLRFIHHLCDEQVYDTSLLNQFNPEESLALLQALTSHGCIFID